MHLVKQEDAAPRTTNSAGDVAGWVIELVRALWLGAKMRREAKRQMCVIETLSIGGRKQLVLVSCAGEQFLVGTGADSVQTIVRVQADPAQREHSHVRGFGERL